ncbi:ABC transporter permease [Pyrococcus kukulkanii]|uniref:ABC transporter permease n=1 Tax=Pyrococcus kukulkanii TaxID=1609559 RepID=UPI0035654DD5
MSLREVLTIAKKEFRVQGRYRVVWLNFALTPFFILAPWVFTAKFLSSSFGESVLVGSIMWYWLNQYFFGLQEAFEDEREEGTLVSVALSPVSLLSFLVGKGLWMIVECSYITVVTITIFKLAGVSAGFKLIPLYIASGFYMFAFSLLWAGLVLRFRRIGGVNLLTQEALAVTSGVTADIRAYPRIVRGVAYLIPLTYTIIVGRKILHGDLSGLSYYLLGLNLVTLAYLLVGIWMIKRGEEFLRISGEWEAW